MRNVCIKEKIQAIVVVVISDIRAIQYVTLYMYMVYVYSSMQLVNDQIQI